LIIFVNQKNAYIAIVRWFDRCGDGGTLSGGENGGDPLLSVTEAADYQNMYYSPKKPVISTGTPSNAVFVRVAPMQITQH
jgi:hypothetical protein